MKVGLETDRRFAGVFQALNQSLAQVYHTKPTIAPIPKLVRSSREAGSSLQMHLRSSSKLEVRSEPPLHP